MIARDEAALLPEALRSVAAIADEIVVADTGSVDATAAIARAAGARVLSHPWRDDFAAARNAAVDQACGTWVLSLDADERLEVADPAALRAFLATAPVDVLGICVTGEPAQRPDPHGMAVRECLWRRHPNRRFFGAVHEGLQRLPGDRVGRMGDLAIYHVRAHPDPETARLRAERNVRIARGWVAVEPASPQAQYVLAMELNAQGQWVETAEVLERVWALLSGAGAAARPPWWGQLARNLVLAMLRIGRPAIAAGHAAEVAAQAPELGEPWLLLARSRGAGGDLPGAADAARRGLAAAHPDNGLCGESGIRLQLEAEAAAADRACERARLLAIGRGRPG